MHSLLPRGLSAVSVGRAGPLSSIRRNGLDLRGRGSSSIDRSATPEAAVLPQTTRRKRHYVRNAAVSLAAATGLYILVDDDRRYNSMIYLEGTRRAALTTIAGLASIADTRYTLREKDGLKLYTKEDRHQLSLRIAQRILDVCLKNGGMFTKLGQHLASMNHALPSEVCETLSVLQDRAIGVPYEEVDRAVRKEFGRPIEELFDEFEAQPIAAASLAQVHRAKRKGGLEKLAVKIQYPHLETQTRGDLLILEALLRVIEFFFPHFAFTWILPEFEKHLSNEMDFRIERNNAELAANILENQRYKGRKGAFYVPKTYETLSGKKVLSMEFVEGFKVNDVHSIEAAGFSKEEISCLVVEAFSSMIYCHGFVHGDPHPGNILLRYPESETTTPDHGLYIQLPEDLRLAYCELWKALLTRDQQLLDTAAQKLGVGEFAPYLPLIFTFRTLGTRAPMGTKMLPAERAELKEKYKGRGAGDWIKEVNEFLQRMPREMLFVLRVNNLIRSLNKDLQGDSSLRFKIYGGYALKGLMMARDEQDGRYKLRPMTTGEALRYQWSLTIMNLQTSLLDKALRFWGWWKGQLFEDSPRVG